MADSQDQILKKAKVVVSGGASGIGLAVCRKLAQAGAQVAAADLFQPEAQETGLQYFRCDVRNAQEVAALFNQVQQKVGTPDTLICCAGQGIHEKLTEGDPEKWKAVIETNLLGALRLVRAFVPGMLEQGFGDVVFISSVAARKPYEYGGIYAATKCALETVAETLRLEVLPTVRVTTVAPGVTATNFFENTVSGFHTATDIGWGAIEPEEVADTVLYAISRPRGVALNHLTLRPALQPF